MTKLKQSLEFKCGPYKGYFGKAAYDCDDRCFSGEVIGTRDVITFVSDKPDDLAKAFQDSVDDYLAFCAEQNQPPEKPFSGHFVARVPPQLHKRLSQIAEIEGVSLNAVVTRLLQIGTETPGFVPAEEEGSTGGELSQSKEAAGRTKVGRSAKR